MKTKMIYLVWLVFLVCSSVVYATDLPDSVFPWGAYANYRSASEIKSMRDDLGFNSILLLWNWRDDSVVVNYMDSGMVVYPNGGPKLPPPADSTINYFKYAEAYYMLIEAEDESSVIRFEYHHPAGSTGVGFWFYEESTPATILDNLSWYHTKYNVAINDTLPTTYYRYIRMKIDTLGSLDTTDIVAKLHWEIHITQDSSVTDSLSILASEFSDGSGGFVDTAVIIDCEEFELDKNRSITYSIYSTGEAKLYIDYFKVPDGYGVLLIDDRYWDEYLIESAYHLFNDSDTAAGWYMCDEPNPEQYRSLAYIDGLIKAEDPLGDNLPRVITTMSKSRIKYLEEFIDITDPELILADIYAFYGGQAYTDTCKNKDYSSYFTDYTGTANTDEHRGLQLAFEHFADTTAKIYDICNEYSLDWWLVPQAFGGLYYNCGCNVDYNGKWFWRVPTKSELSCLVNIAICNGVKGILFWKYHSNLHLSGNCPYYYSPGLLDTNDTKTPSWYAVEEMNSYLKAIDSVYLGLEWDMAYAVCHSEEINPPEGSIIDSIYATSYFGPGASTAITNPDLGWFHVAEFTDTVSKPEEKYFMLVNRACSKDSIGNEAPEITAVVELNPTAIGSDFVFIIDIAKGTNAANWVGYPDTTYAAATNGAISYSTILKAGEGRLFKVVPTNERW